MKRCLSLVRPILMLSLVAVILPAFAQENGEEDLDARNAYEMERLKDPTLGYVPEGMRQKELAFAQTLPYARSKDGASVYSCIGPWNVGGRTRALAVDVFHENIVIAGSVSGGIWRSMDSGQTWQLTSSPMQPFNITCITQDTRKGHEGTWYAGTGELLGGSASNNAAYYYGNGMLKSTDNGITWNVLNTTTSTNNTSFDILWDFIWNTCVRLSDTANTVYAATYGAIYRSQDGGKKWSKTLGGASATGGGYSVYTDVASDSNGIMYASLSSDGWQKGYYRSTDGKKWTLISNASLPPNHKRTSIAIDPNNPDIVYFFAETPDYGKQTFDFRKTPAFHSLWKYEYISGDGSGSGGKWTDLSNNIPSIGGAFGFYYSQTGYDLFIRVMPGNSDAIFLGGTNLWSNLEGFRGTTTTHWIGGYGVNTTMPDYQLYPDHHPDQHNLVFLPSNPNVAFSTCDGGIFKTRDITSANVVWESLNHGYLTTQFYSVAIDHGKPNSHLVIGGLQDNGTFWNRSGDPTSDWVMPGNGDGSYGYITAGAGFYYLSKQEGKIGRYLVDTLGAWTQMCRLDPDSVNKKEYQFINQFAVNPRNEKQLFLPTDKRIWRNNDVTQIPLHAQLDTVAVNTGWEVLTGTVDTNQFWISIACSNTPRGIVYAGSDIGKLIKMPSAEDAQPQVLDITNASFPKNGYINQIAIDPTNADRIMVVFSNYGIPSVFYSADGGTTFTDVSANLEQNPDGSGNGPSCRTAAIMTLSDGTRAFFVGTSAGLYATDTLMGSQTRWVLQAPEALGYAVVNALDFRNEDGWLFAATHGFGMWKAEFSKRNQVLGMEPQNASLNALTVWPNPTNDILHVRWQGSNQARFRLLDEMGRCIYEWPIKQVGDTYTLNLPPVAAGIYYLEVLDQSHSARSTVVVTSN